MPHWFVPQSLFATCFFSLLSLWPLHSWPLGIHFKGHSSGRSFSTSRSKGVSQIISIKLFSYFFQNIYHYMGFSGIFILCLPISIFVPQEPEPCLPCSSLYPQCLEWSLAQKRCSKNICGTNKQTNDNSSWRRETETKEKERKGSVGGPRAMSSTWFLSLYQSLLETWAHFS